MAAAMSKVSAKLRRAEGMYLHWCPACEELHPLPDRWKFDGDLNSPTFQPSFKHTGGPKDARTICHYILGAGILHFCGDCTHAMAGKAVPLPDLPD